MLEKLIGIGIAGACGTLARYWLSGSVYRWLGRGFPWGTAVVNIFGCFLFGIVLSIAGERWAISSEMRTIILTGFMGAFTTFSTFASETGQLLAGAEFLAGLGNIVFQIVAGVGFFVLGQAIGRTI